MNDSAINQIKKSLFGLALICLAGIPPAAAQNWQKLISVKSTAAATASTVRFAVIGDYGIDGQPEADVATLVKNLNPDFVITTGDNNYPDGSAATIDANIGKHYHDFIFPYTGGFGAGAAENRFFPSPGNHDWNAANAQPYLNYFTLPAGPGNERYYDFVRGPVQLFALDSDPSEPDGVTSASVQGQWLKNALAASTAPWKVVYMHHPPYSSGPHGSTAALQWPFKEWGASAVLSGHDHTYERIIANGFAYFVNGLGGNSPYNFGTPVEGSQLRYNEDYGAMLVTATLNQITFRFYTRGGSVIDPYVINHYKTLLPMILR